MERIASAPGNSHFEQQPLLYPVIPAGMPESSAMDGKLLVAQVFDWLRGSPKFAILGRWIPASLPE